MSQTITQGELIANIQRCQKTAIKTTAEARKFLRRAGTKVALQVCFEGTWIFAEKADFINAMLSIGPDFVDYDGTPSYAFGDGTLLYIPCGTNVGVAS